MTTYNPELARNLRLEDSDKSVVRQDIARIAELARTGRENGLLALDDLCANLEPALLRLGVRLVVDGTDTESVEQALRIALHAGGHEGVELVRRLVIVDGVLGIQAGTNPTLLATILSAYLGVEAAEEAASS
jgi:flagellar motor component MotA